MRRPEIEADIAIIGSGIVGLAAAWHLRHDHRVVVLEKESAPALHQTGRNSGVIHSGLYYRPSSAKARLSVVGAAMLRHFCHDHSIPVRETGKLVVAAKPSELPALEALAARGSANGIEGIRSLSPTQIGKLEPAARGEAALFVPSTGLVDFRAVASRLVSDVEDSGGLLATRFEVTGIDDRRRVELSAADGRLVTATSVINCAGLHADRIARLAGAEPSVQIVPFKGVYHRVIHRDLVGRPVYPVPDPRFPFLGVHLTPTVTGGLEAGPNAVLATGREAYRARDVSLRDLWEVLTFAGFWSLARMYWKTGLAEMWRAASRHAFANELRKLVPAVEDDWLVPAGSGIRAQAVRPDGALVDDFLFERAGGVLSVLNAPSPAATASLAIGQEIATLALGDPGPASV